MKLMNIPYNNYKTQRCKYFDENGVCKFGKNCSYAHGDQELRNPYDNLPVPPMFAQGMMDPAFDMMMYELPHGSLESDVKLVLTSSSDDQESLLIRSMLQEAYVKLSTGQ